MSTTSLSRSAALFGAVLLCGALGACGGGGGDAPAAPVEPPAPPVVVLPPPPPASFAYLLQADKVEVCRIDGGDLLVDCLDAGVSGYEGMYAMGVAGSHAYFANLPGGGDPPRIIHCSIGATGALSGCAETGPTDLQSPYGLTVHGSTLYIGDFGTPVVWKCEIKLDGSLDPCVDAGFPDTLTNGAEDLRIVGTTAYLLHFDENIISRCQVLPDGSFSGCAATEAAGFSAPEGFAIHGNYVYVANSGSSNVSRCVIDTNGSLGDCVNAGDPGLISPTQVVIRGSTAYISDSDASVGLTRCGVASDGFLTDCTSTPGRALNSIAIRQ